MITSAEGMARIEKMFLLEKFGKYAEEGLFEADDETLNEMSQEMINNFLGSGLPEAIAESEIMTLILEIF